MRSVPRAASPCVSVCRMDERTGWCAGCQRTLDEIAAWSRLSPSEREVVWQRIEQRRAAGLSRPVGGLRSSDESLGNTPG